MLTQIHLRLLLVTAPSQANRAVELTEIFIFWVTSTSTHVLVQFGADLKKVGRISPFDGCRTDEASGGQYRQQRRWEQ
jgi:hypothetical protein